jgi:hypothetical protein
VKGRLQGPTAGMNMLQLFRENRGENTESERGVSGAFSSGLRRLGYKMASKGLNISKKFSKRRKSYTKKALKIY